MNAVAKVRESMQQNLLALVAFDDEYGQQVVDTVPVDLFEGHYGVIAGQIYDYWQEQRRAPGDHTGDLIEEIKTGGDAERRLLHEIIREMIGLYDNSSWNIKYVLGNLERFMTEQHQKRTIMAAAEAVNARADPSEVAAIFARGATVGGEITSAQVLLKPSEMGQLRQVAFYWHPFLPWNMLSLIAGLKGIGKTSLLAEIAADLSTRSRPLATVYIGKETSPDGFRALVKAHGGDEERLRFFGRREGKEVLNDPPDRLKPDWLQSFEVLLTREREAGTPVGLIAIEPLMSFIDPKMANSDAGVREVLDRLALIADRHKLMVVGTSHLTKNREAPLRDRIIGSVAVLNTARSANVVFRDPDDGGDRRLLYNLIGNYAAPGCDNTVGFRLKSQQRGYRVAFERDLFHLDEEDAEEKVARRRPGGRPQQEAAEALAKWLKDGPLKVDEVVALAKEAKISWRSIERAKTELGVKSRKEGVRRWRWSLER